MNVTFGIIGYGRFGKLWAKHLSRFGRVLVFDKNNALKITGKNISKATANQAARADMLFLLVPISEIADCCKQIKNRLMPNTIVIDGCSVKVFPAQAMKQNLKADQAIVATHPLFGPDSAGQSKTLKGFKIAVCPVRVKKSELGKFIALLKKLGLKIFQTTPENHDKQMAKSQALIHFIGRGLAPLNLKPQEIATPDYLNLLNIKKMVLNDTKQLFLDMENYNPYAKNVWKNFLLTLETLGQEIAEQKKDIGQVRHRINELDEQIIRAVSQRMELSKRVGTLKNLTNLKILDKTREKQLAKLHENLSKKLRVDSLLVKKVFNLIIYHSRKIQKQ